MRGSQQGAADAAGALCRAAEVSCSKGMAIVVVAVDASHHDAVFTFAEWGC